MLEKHSYMGTGSASVLNEETKDIRALCYWCPGLVVFSLYFSLLIFDKQSQRIIQFWDILECNFCFLHDMSSMDVN